MNRSNAQHNKSTRRSQIWGALFFAAAAAMLGGCSNDAQNGSLIGAGLGAGLGAIIGHQSGHAGEGAAIGAAAGGVGGYMVGNESDKQKARGTGRYNSY